MIRRFGWGSDDRHNAAMDHVSVPAAARDIQNRTGFFQHSECVDSLSRLVELRLYLRRMLRVAWEVDGVRIGRPMLLSLVEDGEHRLVVDENASVGIAEDDPETLRFCLGIGDDEICLLQTDDLALMKSVLKIYVLGTWDWAERSSEHSAAAYSRTLC